MALRVNNLEGNEIADDYTRTAAKRGRWGETWDAFKASFGKVILINIFILITFLPGVAVIIFRNMYVANMFAIYPFNANTGLGYGGYSGMLGFAEQIYLYADLMFYSLLIVAGFIASVGVAGGAYSIKKLVNTSGKFTLKGFFHGVKVCYFNTVLPVTIFMLFFFATKIVGDWKDLVIARGGSGAGPITAYVFVIIATVLVGIYCAWLLAVGVSYRVKFTQLFKNAFVLLIGSPIHTVFFAGFALIPVWIYLIGTAASFMKIIAYIFFVFLGFSFILMVWMSFTQWVFDMYVTPNLKAAKEEADSKKTPQQLAAEKEEDDKRTARELLAAGKSELIGRPIKPIEDEVLVKPLGKTFSRADVNAVDGDRTKMKEGIAAYEQEHKNDSVYVEYNKLFAEREKALQSTDKKGKKKKVSKDNLLK
ncbi:MAG: hypothetical protein K2K60_06645 [Clostridia bacterium]|nr:hypothetical protein [Clostridia bacterium]